MDLKRRMPLLRWSVWRMATGARNITTTGQIGDGREAAAVEYVLQNARAGDIDDVLATIDKFAYEKSMLINVGDEKGQFLDAAVRRADPAAGTGAGHLLRLRRAADRQGRAERQGVLRRTRRSQRRQRPTDLGSCRGRRPGDVCRRHHRRRRAHPGPLANEHGFTSGALDFVFLDHDKDAYLDDLKSILDRGWLHPGSIVVADNVRVPGAPKYREYMRQQQGKLWNTVEHKTHLEYQSLVSDLVLESDYLASYCVSEAPTSACHVARSRQLLRPGCAPAHTSRSACTVTSV